MTAPDRLEREREALSLLMLGAFFSILALLVEIGSAWAVARPHALVVNVVAGLILLAVGLAMLALGWRFHKRARAIKSSPADEHPPAC